MFKERATTLDEKIEIISYCLSEGKNYNKTSEKFNVSYSQIDSWIKVYEKYGVAGLSHIGE
ncbi:MAG: helix-turn-helix domain-containing protein [Oscillospiraceae bacterium]|nr:helix-turn-helix domain-containing protein [Oscillospiraceae bacterium]